MGTYVEKDCVQVKDKVSGDVLPDLIPKAWLGTDLAPNVEQVKATRAKADDDKTDA